jgi:acetyltransferase-like isoleucine patch superfamily enzyme
MRKLTKYTILGVLYVLVSPLGVSARLAWRLLGSRILFDMFAQMVALAPGMPGNWLRGCYYHQALSESHLQNNYNFGVIITKPDTRIGQGVGIGKYSSVGLAQIGSGTVIAGYVSILSGRHQHNLTNPDEPIYNNDDKFTRVLIGDNTYIGEHCVVMADIGQRTIVGAGAVVVKSIPEYVVAVGNPARTIKQRHRSGMQKSSKLTQTRQTD